MLPKGALICGGLAAVARASQPGAVEPVAAPMRDLQWGQINFLHTTDTHGWHGGHLQESQYSADWGDYVSFAHHLRKQADEKGVDLLLVDTGDRVEGNGLYDASTPKGEYTYDIYREQDVDIICTGNHELYQADAIDREHDRTVVNFKDTYIASNLDYVDPKSGERKPMTRRYRKFQTKNQKLNIVAFGFLFDFTGNANNSAVQPVKDTVKEDWFQEAIREKADLFVVIGHVGIRMEEFKVIFRAIRKQNWFTPIAFLGGHAHVRDATLYDAKAFAIASGRYFETIGWMSVDGIKMKGDKDKDKDKEVTTQAVKFNRRYIDNNLLGLYHHSGLNESTFPTEHGRNVSVKIAEARKALDLDYAYGCAPQDYWMARTPYPDDHSIYSWLEREVLPGIIVNDSDKALPRLAIINTGAIRFDIFKGAFTRDTTYIVSPFLSKMAYVPAVPYKVASKVIKLLNSGGRIFEGTGLDSRYLMMPEQWTRTESIVYPTVKHGLLGVEEEDSQRRLGDDGSKEEPDLVGGYTTKDDIGNDGDDAIHSPLSFYAQPNCIQSEIGMPEEGDPEKVDLVFTDFVQPWVLVALKFSGGDYSDKDVKLWDDAPFTDLLAGWIKENWKGDC